MRSLWNYVTYSLLLYYTDIYFLVWKLVLLCYTTLCYSTYTLHIHIWVKNTKSSWKKRQTSHPHGKTTKEVLFLCWDGMVTSCLAIALQKVWNWFYPKTTCCISFYEILILYAPRCTSVRNTYLTPPKKKHCFCKFYSTTPERYFSPLVIGQSCSPILDLFYPCN
jgi:hypothetical protein